jgi:hypothetical protein
VLALLVLLHRTPAVAAGLSRMPICCSQLPQAQVRQLPAAHTCGTRRRLQRPPRVATLMADTRPLEAQVLPRSQALRALAVATVASAAATAVAAAVAAGTLSNGRRCRLPTDRAMLTKGLPTGRTWRPRRCRSWLQLADTPLPRRTGITPRLQRLRRQLRTRRRPRWRRASCRLQPARRLWGSLT